MPCNITFVNISLFDLFSFAFMDAIMGVFTCNTWTRVDIIFVWYLNYCKSYTYYSKLLVMLSLRGKNYIN